MFNVSTIRIADKCTNHHVLFYRFADDIQVYVTYNPMISDKPDNAKQLLIQCINSN